MRLPDPIRTYPDDLETITKTVRALDILKFAIKIKMSKYSYGVEYPEDDSPYYSGGEFAHYYDEEGRSVTGYRSGSNFRSQQSRYTSPPLRSGGSISSASHGGYDAYQNRDILKNRKKTNAQNPQRMEKPRNSSTQRFVASSNRSGTNNSRSSVGGTSRGHRDPQPGRNHHLEEDEIEDDEDDWSDEEQSEEEDIDPRASARGHRYQAADGYREHTKPLYTHRGPGGSYGPDKQQKARRSPEYSEYYKPKPKSQFQPARNDNGYGQSQNERLFVSGSINSRGGGVVLGSQMNGESSTYNMGARSGMTYNMGMAGVPSLNRTRRDSRPRAQDRRRQGTAEFY